MALRWIEKKAQQLGRLIAQEQYSPQEKERLESESWELFSLITTALAAQREAYPEWNENCRSLVQRADMVRNLPDGMLPVLQPPAFSYSLVPAHLITEQFPIDPHTLADRSLIREMTLAQARYGITRLSSRYHLHERLPVSMMIEGRRPGFYQNTLSLLFFPERITHQSQLAPLVSDLGLYAESSTFQLESNHLQTDRGAFTELQGYRLPQSSQHVWAYAHYQEQVDNDSGTLARSNDHQPRTGGWLRPAVSTLR